MASRNAQKRRTKERKDRQRKVYVPVPQTTYVGRYTGRQRAFGGPTFPVLVSGDRFREQEIASMEAMAVMSSTIPLIVGMMLKKPNREK